MSVGLDVGSSSLKAIRLDDRGRTGSAARRPIGTRRRRGGRVEHDAEEIARAARAVLREVSGRGGPSGPIDLGIATQRSTVLFWDRDTGRPLTPAYSWQDLRGAALVARLSRGRRGGRDAGGARGAAGGWGAAEGWDAGGAEASIVARTGLRLSPHYSAAKIAWALGRVPGLARRVAAGRALWGPLGTFLLYRLSGGALYACDHANAQRTLLFDLEARAWDPSLFSLFGLDPLLDAPALPALLPTSPAGGAELAMGRLRFRLRALTGDQQAALVGLGGRRPGTIAINYGSGAFVLINVGPRPARVPGLLTSLLASWSDADGRPAAWYAVEGSVNAAATALEWAQRRLGLSIRTADLDRYVGDGGGGPAIHFLPAVAGLGAPRWDPFARPRFAGAPPGADPRDLVRAVVESIAQRCAEIVLAAEAGLRGRGGRGDAGRLEVGGGPGGRAAWRARRAPVLAAGGLTRCRTLLQLQADLLRRPLVVRDSPDATALGAAFLAARPARSLFAPDPRAGAAAPGARPPADPAGGGRASVFRPRLSAAESRARHRSWSRAVYGAGRGVERGAGGGGRSAPRGGAGRDPGPASPAKR